MATKAGKHRKAAHGRASQSPESRNRTQVLRIVVHLFVGDRSSGRKPGKPLVAADRAII
jgi:hypothetical protein